MATVINFFEAHDGAKWLASPRRDNLFAPLGITTRTFTDPENPNRMAMLMEIPDEDAALQGLNSAATKATMVLDGVKMETFRLLIET